MGIEWLHVTSCPPTSEQVSRVHIEAPYHKVNEEFLMVQFVGRSRKKICGEYSSHLSSRGYIWDMKEEISLMLAMSTKSFEVSLFSEFAKQVVEHNPDIAASGKPMEEKKFCGRKICYRNKNSQCVRVTLSKLLLRLYAGDNCWVLDRRPRPSIGDFTPPRFVLPPKYNPNPMPIPFTGLGPGKPIL